MKREAELAFWKGESHDIADHDLTRYPRHLKLKPWAFQGKRVLDVGCGPIPYASAFKGCELWGLDPLVDEYRRDGYPMDAMRYVCASAERMPFKSAFFDAVISVNALDHTDDFPAVAREIARVSRNIIHLEVHYHEPTMTEPWALDDDLMRQAFPMLRKLCETPYSDFHPGAPGTVAIWSTR